MTDYTKQIAAYNQTVGIRTEIEAKRIDGAITWCNNLLRILYLWQEEERLKGEGLA